MARGQAQKTSTQGVDALALAVRTTLIAEGCSEIQESQDGREHQFVTRKSALNWQLDGVATVTPDASGSRLSVSLAGREDSPAALLDGWKTRKAAEKLAGKIVG